MVTIAHPEQKFTAVQTILLAAEDLTKAGNLEFSEFDLTVAAWKRDGLKFGLRGYANIYPDHKRVMMEIMGQKPNSPVFRKLLEKIRPNTYRLTAQGKETARKLRTGGDVVTKPVAPATRPNTVKPATAKDLYEVAAQYTAQPEFRRWRDNPEEPRDWMGAAAFLGVQKGLDVDPAERIEEIRDAIKASLEWCNTQNSDYLNRGQGQPGTPIHARELSEMLDFLQALMYRFESHLVPRTKVKK